MEQLFLQILHMSVLASWGIFVVLALRFFLKRISSSCAYLLWGIVLLRLACPVVLEAPFGLLPTEEISIVSAVSKGLGEQEKSTGLLNPEVSSAGDLTAEGFTVRSLDKNFPETGEKSSDLRENVESERKIFTAESWEENHSSLLWKISLVWAAGVILYWLGGMLSFLKFRKWLYGAVPLQENKKTGGSRVFLAENIQTPFVMGILHPRIYLPPGLEAREQRYILLHERIHIRRGDHWIKLLGFFLQGLHWFNPLVHLAFFFMEQDMEMSCDEQVLKKLGKEIKQEYSTSLLKLSTGRKQSFGMPLAFGEGDTKKRIRHVLNYKKPSLWLGGLALGLIILAGAGLFLRSGNEKSIDPALTISQLEADAQEADCFWVDCEGTGRTRISSQQLKRWLTETEFRKKQVPSPYELSYTYEVQDLGSREQPVCLRLYEAEPELVMVYNQENWQYYSIEKEDYEAFEHFILASSSFEPYEIQAVEPAEWNPQPVGEVLEGLFAKLLEKPSVSSNPWDLIQTQGEVFEEILSYDSSTLAYCFEAFEQGGQTDLKGALMREACCQIAGSTEEAAEYENAQQWYDGQKAAARKLEMELGRELVEKYHPLEDAILHFLAGEMEEETKEILLPDYLYEGENPEEKLLYQTEKERMEQAVLESGRDREEFGVWAIRMHGSVTEEEQLKIFATVYTGTYRLLGTRVEQTGGSVIPVAVTYACQETEAGENTYTLLKYEMAQDGSYFIPSIEAFCTMPVSKEPIKGLAEAVIEPYGQDAELNQMMEAHLQEHLERYGFADIQP